MTFRRLSAVDRCIASLRSAVFGQYAACRIEGLHFFDLLCRIAVLLFFSACGFFICGFLRCFWFFLCLCLDLWFCFALCKRIFLCCLRSFALARATSPFLSQRAGPQRFLVWVRVWWCCAFHKQNAKYPLPAWCAAHSIAVGDFVTVLFKLSASFFFSHLTKVKYPKKE